MLDNRHKTVGYDGHAYLDADSVLRGAPEPLDLEMLLQPLVEKLNLPPVLIQDRYLKSRQVERIRKKGEVSVLLIVMVSDQAELLGILLEGRLFGQDNLGIRDHILRKSAPPFQALVLEVLLGPYDKEGVLPMDLVKFREGVVPSVEHVVRARLVRDHAHYSGVVHRCLRDMEERRHRSLQVVEEVYFHAAFPFAELGPPEDRQAKRYRGRIESIDVPVQLEDVVYPLSAGLVHHVESEVLEDPIVPVLVGSGQGCLGHGLGAHSHVIAFRLVSLQGDNQVSKAFSAA